MVLNVADRVRYLREKNGMTQHVLAKKLGISRNSVNAWEMSLSCPSLANVAEMSRIFHVTVDALLFDREAVLIDTSNLSDEEKEIILRLVECFSKGKK